MGTKRFGKVVLVILVTSLFGVAALIWVTSSNVEAEAGPVVAAVESDPANKGCVAPADLEVRDILSGEENEALPWQCSDEQVDVYFATDGLDSEYVPYVHVASNTWSPSVCVDTHVVGTCPLNVPCVPVATEATAGDGETDGVFTGEYIDDTMVGGTLHIYRDFFVDYPDDERQVVVTHEMGHALGLGHRKGDDVMRFDGGDSTDPLPDDIDFANLLAIYGKP